MYVRISRLQFPVNRVEDAIRSFQDTTLPAVKALPGFSGVALQVRDAPLNSDDSAMLTTPPEPVSKMSGKNAARAAPMLAFAARS